MAAGAGETWDAVVDLFAARNIPIRTIERASGLVAAEELSLGGEGSEWADCGRLNGSPLYPNRAIYNVLVRGDSAGSSVKATVRWVYLNSDRRAVECSTTHAWEEAFEAEVRSRAESPRMAGAMSSSAATAPPRVDAAPAPSPTPPAPVSPRRAPASAPPPTARADEPPTSGDARPNNLLLSFEAFRRAMGDMERKGLVLSYRERTIERLEVDLTARAFGEPTLEYQLTRLFLAYGETMNEDTQPTVVIRANAQQVGLYTRAGLRWDEPLGPR
ncbi:MAG TPA: hypothetical protein VFN40_12610 [Gemmatimonadales bacterium]|nr:hypothetical protein [Gemmatimonadales bacterium]